MWSSSSNDIALDVRHNYGSNWQFENATQLKYAMIRTSVTRMLFLTVLILLPTWKWQTFVGNIEMLIV